MTGRTLGWPIASTLVVTLLAPPALAQSPPEPVAVLLAVEGPVHWRGSAETSFTPASAGTKLFVGAVLRTGARGHARLRWSNGGDFRLMPLTEITLADPDAVETRGGQIWSQFTEKLLRPFFFRSPSATAVVRGTTLGFGVDASGATRVAVQEGKVEVTGLGDRTIMVTGGQAVTASPAGQLGPVGPIAPTDSSPFTLSADAEPAGPAPAQVAGRGGWLRMDDWTRRGLDWLDRHRASERMPLLRQEMASRQATPVNTAGYTAGPHAAPAPGEAVGERPQAQAPAERTGTASGLPPTSSNGAAAPTPERVIAPKPGDAWGTVPEAATGTPNQPAGSPGDTWGQVPPSVQNPTSNGKDRECPPQDTFRVRSGVTDPEHWDCGYGNDGFTPPGNTGSSGKGQNNPGNSGG